MIVRANRAGQRSLQEEASDAATIEASKVDPSKFAKVFDRHAPVIYRYLARRAGVAAVDLVADTFVAAFANRDRYDPSYADARPWLYGIASKELARYFRAEHRDHRLTMVLPPLRDVPGHADRVASDATAQAMREDLEVALANLRQGDRDVLILVAWEELTYEEVALALDIPIGTVRSRLHRARSQLRLVLAELVGQDAIAEVLTNE